MLTRALVRLALQLLRRHRRRGGRVTLGVRVALWDRDRVLLVRHRLHPGWHLPGGGVEAGESVEQAARRELREETGTEAGPLRLHGVFSGFVDGASDHVVVLEGRGEGAPAPGDLEIAEARWFARDRLPADLSPGTARRLAELGAASAAARLECW